MLVDTAIVADLQTHRIDQADARAATKAGFEVSTQRQQRRGHPSDKALVAHQFGKRSAPIDTNVFGVVLERAITLLVKGNHNRHAFAQTQLSRSVPPL